MRVSYYHYMDRGYEILVFKEGGPVDILVRNDNVYIE